MYGETLGNPLINVFPFEEVARIGQEYGIPLMIDNTFATPYLCRPFEYGANIVVHSATKFIGGHGTSIGGVIVDGGNFEWDGNPRFPNFNTPDDSYHGLVYADLGAAAFILKARVQILRDIGGCLSPFNSFLFLQGLETLSLRIERHVQNAQRVAEFLHEHPRVSWVAYPGLKDSPQYAAAQKYLPRGAGRHPGVRHPGRGSRRQAASSRACSCSATWQTWATPRAWRSTPPPPPTASSTRSSRPAPGSRRTLSV